jgi:hypothetical protein
MRTYWIKIVLGALGVFAVGMVLITITRHGIAKAKRVAESSDPISIPLAFVPFRLGGDRLGTFDRAVLIRKSPKEVTAIDLAVTLTDSASAGRLADCSLFARLLQEQYRGVEFSDADFTCLSPDSAAAHGAERFGQVAFEPGHLTVPLFVPAEVAHRLRQGTEIHAETASDAADSIADAADRMADSIGEAASRSADSIATLHEHRADSIRERALRRADSVRRQAARLRDSIRAAVARP